MTTAPDLQPAALENLRDRVQGRVVGAEDPGWGEASLAWTLVPQAPLVVVEAADVDDVVATVLWARENGVAVAAQPTGHGATGAASGAVLLRTRSLDGVAVDVEERLARVGAGVKWGQLLSALDGTGLIGPAGSNPDVAVVGYLLGGGLAWFARLCGYAAHLLRAAEVVDADGRLRWISDESDPELMWALRGGGGDLVIVTQVELELMPAAGLYGGKLVFPVAEAAAVLDAFVEVTRAAPRELTLWATIVHFPDLEILPEPLRGGSFATVDATYVGSAEEAERLIAPIRRAGTVLDDTTGEITIGRLGDVADEPTDPTPTIEWASFLADFTPETVGRLADAIGDRGRTAVSMVQVRHVGGALADPPNPSPAVADRVSAPYLVGALGIPVTAESVEPIRASLAELVEVLRPEVSDEPLPLNFLAVGEPVERALAPETLARLQELKRALDPARTIRGNVPLLS